MISRHAEARNLSKFLLAIIFACALLITGEAFSLLALGLGAPPLSIAHETIEYMMAPGQDVRRFGNRVLVNEFGMRSQSIATDLQPKELRVLAFGDSVLNGGSQTDHEALATTRAAKRLAAQRQAPVTIANISAGSWGPGNHLGYISTYGLFKADMALFVLSSHDASDEPAFGPLDPLTHPTAAPASALLEGLERYAPRYLPNWRIFSRAAPNESEQNPEEFRSEKSLTAIMQRLAADGIPACILLHPALAETIDRNGPGFDRLLKFAAKHNIPALDLLPYYRTISPDVALLYRDGIHINAKGQEGLMLALVGIIDRKACKIPI
jgi:lysophospholipase L1-like esterase